MRLVDIELLLKECKQELKELEDCTEVETLEESLEDEITDLERLPVINPESLQAKASWLHPKEPLKMIIPARKLHEEPVLKCSRCGCMISETDYKLWVWNYCPVCGSKMAADVDIEQNFKEVSPLEASKIIADPAAAEAGLFWCADENAYVGIDNSTHEAWTEDFSTKQALFDWLKGGED